MTSPGCTLSSLTTPASTASTGAWPDCSRASAAAPVPGAARSSAVQDVGPERRRLPVAARRATPRRPAACPLARGRASQPGREQRGLAEPGGRRDQRDRRVRGAVEQLGQPRPRARRSRRGLRQEAAWSRPGSASALHAAASTSRGCTPRRRARRRADVHPLAGAAEDAEHLGRALAGAAEPVRHLGVELGRLADAQDEVLVAEDEPHPAGQHVEPLEPVVRARVRRRLGRRDDDLPRLDAARAGSAAARCGR